QWRTYDPTPGSEATRKNAGILDHIGDVISSGAERLAIALNNLGLLGSAAVLAAFVAFLSLLRWVGKIVGTRRRRRMQHTSFTETPALPCFDKLTDALAREGHERQGSEPIESFARRLAALNAPWSFDVASALFRYADLRYGGIGDEKEIDKVV